MQLWFLQGRGVLNTKVIDFRKILIFSAFIIPAAIVVFTLAGILKKTAGIENRLISEFSGNNEQLEIIKQNLVKLSSDVNQTRSLIGLPETEYSFETANDSVSEDTDSRPENDNTVYFLGFEYLKNHYNEIGLYRTVSDIAGSDIFIKAAKTNSLTINEKADSYDLADSADGKILFKLKADISDNTVVINPFFSIIEKGIFTSVSPSKASDYLNKNTAKARELFKKLSINISEIKNISADNTVGNSLKKNRLYLDDYSSDNVKTSVSIKTEAGTVVAEISLNHQDLTFSFCGRNYTDLNSLKNDLINIGNICDIRTQDQKRFEKSINDLDLLSTDSAFKDYLSDKGFSISDTVREDNDYFYYDIISESAKTKIGSFAVQKVSGEIYLTDHEEIPLSSINMFMNYSKKKN